MGKGTKRSVEGDPFKPAEAKKRATALGKGFGEQVKDSSMDASWLALLQRISSSSVSKNKQNGFNKSVKSGEIPIAKTFNDAHRDADPGMDEWISTSLTREILTGMLDGVGYNGRSTEEQQQVRDIYEAFSKIRSPTVATGFALKDRAMQHPTSRENAIFADPYSTASSHSYYDSKRRDYIIQAVEKAEFAGESGVISAVMASIEFTLNYMMAPAEASNVRPFMNNPQRKQPVSQAEIDSQMAVREHFKSVYVSLKGVLRELPTGQTETSEQSTKRYWQGESNTTSFSVVPPSPRRSIRKTLEAESLSVNGDLAAPFSVANTQGNAIISDGFSHSFTAMSKISLPIEERESPFARANAPLEGLASTPLLPSAKSSVITNRSMSHYQ